MIRKPTFIPTKLAFLTTVVALALVTPVYATSSDEQNGEEPITYSAPPSMTVVKQWSHVRAQPEVTGVIVDSLERGSQIRVLDIVNKWFLVQYNNGKKSGTGFMHQSLLGYFTSSSDDSETEVNITEVISSSR